MDLSPTGAKLQINNLTDKEVAMKTDELLKICKSRYEVKNKSLVIKEKHKGSNRSVGDKAGHITKLGYVCVGIKGKLYQAHVIVWLIYNGKMPDNEIDHIDGDKLNNDISNLRDVTRSENMRNIKRGIRNKSGTIGVHWDKDAEKWRAKLVVEGKMIHLGRFSNIEDAIKARKEAEVKHGFHANHGR